MVYNKSMVVRIVNKPPHKIDKLTSNSIIKHTIVPLYVLSLLPLFTVPLSSIPNNNVLSQSLKLRYFCLNNLFSLND